MGRPRKSDPARLSGFHARFISLKNQGETDREFASRLGLSPAGVSRLMNGGKPDFDTLIAIANKVGVAVGWLAAGEAPSAAKPHVFDVAESAGDTVDYQLLRVVVETVAETLQSQRRVLPPAKLAEVVALAYSIMSKEDDQQQGSDKIVRLARLAG